MASDPQSLFDQAKCFSCYGISSDEALELALLQTIAGGGGSGPPPVVPLNPAVVNWASRVVTNGGADPSTATKNAMSTFYNALQAAGLDTKMKALCVFVPDSLIAATTPLIVGNGIDPWTNHGFVTADLTVDGLKGDGVAKYLQTGLVPSAIFAVGNSGVTLVNTLTSQGVEQDFGCALAAAGSASLLLSISNGTNLIAYSFDEGGSFLNTVNSFWEGYLSANRVANNDFKCYKASPTVAHATLASSAVVTALAAPNIEMLMFCWNLVGVPSSFSRKRFFIAAVHDGFTAAQSISFYNAIATLQATISPVVQHALVTAWQANVSANGGSAPSAATIAGLNRYCAMLDTFGLTSKIIALNPFVPDNLIASLTPLIANAGLTLWTNTGFIAGDLTVNGLKGDGVAKFLSTGITGAAAGLSVSNGGLTMMTQTNSEGGENDMGSNNGVISFALIIDFAGSSYNDCYDQVATRIGPVANGGFMGYHSNNRTTTTAFSVYQATSSAAHAAIGSSGGTNVSVPALLTFPIFVFCWNNSGAAASFSVKRVALASVHQGLTAAQSSTFFDCSQQLRVVFGGGMI